MLTAGLGRLYTAALCDLLGSEVPSNALCDSSLRPFPVGMRSEGDKQGQQNLPDPSVGGGGDVTQVCHRLETNALAATASLLIQIRASFFQSAIYGSCSSFWIC